MGAVSAAGLRGNDGMMLLLSFKSGRGTMQRDTPRLLIATSACDYRTKAACVPSRSCRAGLVSQLLPSCNALYFPAF